MTDSRSRMILYTPHAALFACEESVWPPRLIRRRDGVLWLFALWFHVGFHL